MAKKMTFPILAICFLAATLYPAYAHADVYRIILKSGEIITAKHYEYQNEDIVVYKLGGSFTFSRSDVARIEKESSETVNTPDAPESPAKEKAARKSGQKGNTSK